MILMAIYHFCFDLNYFGVLNYDFNHDSFWLMFRAVIMTLFTGLVGVSLSLSGANIKSASYKKRLGKLFACAVTITVVTSFVFPQSWVFFGILHFIFFASLLGPILVRAPWMCLGIGIVFVIMPAVYTSFIFMQPSLIILGLSPIKPMTEDFAPILPWLGVTMIGVFIGHIVKKYPRRMLTAEIKSLSTLGHYSLRFYMIHQLVLFPIAWLVSYILNYF